MTDLEQLIKLARITRSAFEKVARKQGYQSNLGGLCYDASNFLRRMAEAYGIPTDLGIGSCHWFVLYGNIVIDVTSTQFDQPEKIAVLPLSVAEERGSWWKLQGRNSDPPKNYRDKMTEIAEEAFENMIDGISDGIGEAEL
jgi:hypothetical protein